MPASLGRGAAPGASGSWRLRGDIDGDGQPDRVVLRYAVDSPASCGFVLVVKTRSRTFAVRVPEWYKPPADIVVGDRPFAEPYLAAVIQLDPHRSQVVVARSHGASVASVSFYGITGGTLARWRFTRGSTRTSCASLERSALVTPMRSADPAGR
jgi:hypothetical protein